MKTDPNDRPMCPVVYRAKAWHDGQPEPIDYERTCEHLAGHRGYHFAGDESGRPMWWARS